MTSRYTHRYTKEPYLVESQGLEPRMPEASDLQSDAVTCSARSPLVLTHSNSLSFCPIVLCTDGRVCVIKQTTHLLWTCRCNLSVRQSALLRTVFTHLGYRPRLIIPVSALICGMFYMHRRVAFPITCPTITKNPRVVNPGVL